jgi:hypothetical protein
VATASQRGTSPAADAQTELLAKTATNQGLCGDPKE